MIASRTGGLSVECRRLRGGGEASTEEEEEGERTDFLLLFPLFLLLFLEALGVWERERDCLTVGGALEGAGPLEDCLEDGHGWSRESGSGRTGRAGTPLGPCSGTGDSLGAAMAGSGGADVESDADRVLDVPREAARTGSAQVMVGPGRLEDA